MPRFVLLCLLLAACRTPGSEPVRVLAAASLAEVVDSVAAVYVAAHPGTVVEVSYGGSALLARQAERGAPADLFVSADPGWTAYLAARGHGHGEPAMLAANRLVVVAADTAGGAGAVLRRAARIATADPEAAPAGRYARDVLACLGLTDTLASRLVPLQDVRAATQAVASRLTDAGLVYATDARAAGLRAVPVPELCQPRIVYAAIALTDRPEASALLDALATRTDVWTYFGFAPR